MPFPSRPFSLLLPLILAAAPLFGAVKAPELPSLTLVPSPLLGERERGMVDIVSPVSPLIPLTPTAASPQPAPLSPLRATIASALRPIAQPSLSANAASAAGRDLQAAITGERFLLSPVDAGLGASLAAREPEPSRTTEILIVHSTRERALRPDLDESLAAFASRWKGRAHLLNSGRPRSFFEATFAAEVERASLDEAARDLKALPDIDVFPLSEAVSVAGGPAAAVATEAELTESVAALSRGSLPQRLGALSRLANAILATDPAALSTLPEAARDAAGAAIHEADVPLIETYNLLAESRRQEWRERLHAAPGSDAGAARIERVELEIARRALTEPRPGEALRRLFADSLRAIDRLGTPASEQRVLGLLEHAEHSGFETLFADPAQRARYLSLYLETVSASIRATTRRLAFPVPSDGEQVWYRGSPSTHNLDNFQGRYGYLRLSDPLQPLLVPQPLNAGVIKVLGLAEGAERAAMIDAVVNAIAAGDALLPALRLLAHDAYVRCRLSLHKKRWDTMLTMGSPLSERVEQERRQMLEQAEAMYADSEKIDADTLFMSLLEGLAKFDRWVRFIPGIDETRYIGAVAEIFTRALPRAGTPETAALLADKAFTFLESVKNEAPSLRPAVLAPLKALYASLRATAASTGLEPWPHKTLARLGMGISEHARNEPPWPAPDASMLNRLQTRYRELARVEVDVVQALLRSPNPAHRLAVAATVDFVPDQTLRLEWLAYFLQDPDAGVRLEAARIFSGLSDPALRDELAREFVRGRDAALRLAAAEGLHAVSLAQRLDLIKRLCNDASPEVSNAARAALEGLAVEAGRPESLPMLQAWFDDARTHEAFRSALWSETPEGHAARVDRMVAILQTYRNRGGLENWLTSLRNLADVDEPQKALARDVLDKVAALRAAGPWGPQDDAWSQQNVEELAEALRRRAP